MIRLHTLGALDLRAVGSKGPALLSQPRRLGLLVYLAAANVRGFRRRDSILPMFWPELDEDRARGALRQAVYVLRRDLGEGVIRKRGDDELGVEPNELWLDVTAFEKALAQGDPRAAADLYTGEFLDGFFLSGTGVAFDDWVAFERARLRALAGRALWAVAEQTAETEPGSAAPWIRRAVALAPDDEVTVRRALVQLERIGDRAGALQLYHEFSERLQREYGADPASETKDIGERLHISNGHALANGHAVTRKYNTPVPTVDSSAETPIDVASLIQVDAAPSIPIDAAPLVQEVPLIASRRVFRGWKMVGAGVFAAVLMTSALVAIDGRRNSSLLAATDDLLVGDIESQPQDSLAARALTDLLRVALADTRTLRVVSRADIQRSLGRMLLPGNTRVDVTVAHELAVRNGYEAILLAELTPVGSGYVISAHLQTLGGTELAAASEPASSEYELTAAVGRLSKSLRSRFGESRRTLLAVPPLEQVTTRSMQALALYTQGQDESDGWRGVGSQPPRAVALWTAAIQADSTFAIAHRRLGVALANLGMTKEALQELRAADRFRDRLTDIERLAVRISLQGFLQDHNSAIAAAHEILRLDPNTVWEKWARMQLTWQYRIAGQYDLLEKEYRTRGPVNGDVILWCALLAYQGRMSDALDSARAYYRRYEDSTGSVRLRSARYNLALMHALAFAYDSAIANAAPPGPTDYFSPLIFAASLYARGEFARAAAMQLSIPTKPEGESFAAMAVAPNTSGGAFVSRHPTALFADSIYRNRDAADRPIRPILALALAGHAETARRELDVIMQAADADVLVVRSNEFDLARGAVALAEHHPRDAIQLFTRASTSMDLASLDACRVCVLPWLGRAYEAAGIPDSATIVYERFLSTGDANRYLADASWRAVILERLGALHASRGDTALAVLRLSQFVGLWKNADPALQPRVEKARHRLAELRDTSYRAAPMMH